MPRLSDVTGARIQAGIDLLPVSEATRNSILYEALPLPLAKGAGIVIGLLVMLSVPVPGTDNDFEAPMGQLDDIRASQPAINELVRTLYAEAQEKIRERTAHMTQQWNSAPGVHGDFTGQSPGGLAIP